jgi:hypothetical protein
LADRTSLDVFRSIYLPRALTSPCDIQILQASARAHQRTFIAGSRVAALAPQPKGSVNLSTARLKGGRQLVIAGEPQRHSAGAAADHAVSPAVKATQASRAPSLAAFIDSTFVVKRTVGGFLRVSGLFSPARRGRRAELCPRPPRSMSRRRGLACADDRGSTRRHSHAS